MRSFTTLLMVLTTTLLLSQTTTIEGYIFESGNRGYLQYVSVSAEDIDTEKILGKSLSDGDGFFKIEVPINTKIRLYASKDMFDIKRLETEVGEGKSFVKMEMGRAPGYTFEVTLAEKRSSPDAIVDAISGTRIEVYNNTTRESIMDLKDHESPTFQLNLKKGNHYTLLIRKNGFLSKRMEAKVDVEGCILCFEGVGEVGPGVSDNLTENNAFGVLLANVELERIFEGKTMEIQNLYYGLNKWALTNSAKIQLNKVITLMKDNPNLTIELGSHTDSRGKSDFNLGLSKKRATSAVKYLLRKGEISKSRVVSKGYGENILLNKCADGVKCIETEHAINRRTELKIVGITDMKEVKSLAQMKKEEQLEAEILELMDQEQVQAKNEEELRKKIGEIEEIEEVEKREMEVINEMEKAIQEQNEVENEELESEYNIVEEEEIEVIQEPKKAVEEEVVEQEEIEIEDIEILKEKDVVQEEIEVTDGIAEQILPPVTDGIKVIVYQSTSLLEKDHFVFLRHQGVELYDSGRGKTFYMVGGFKTESDAFRFMYSYIIPDKKYKGPFVAKFTNGVLAVVNQ